MQITQVSTAADSQSFLKIPSIIYKNDPHWIRPLDKDIEAVFDEKKNKAARVNLLAALLRLSTKNIRIKAMMCL
jgi:hypothetical protein